MCTLTYLPTQNGFLFTSNRDESREREPAIFPSFSDSKSGKLLMPLDPQGGGTWILLAENGEAACLLNGAFVNHQRKPPYRKSRGRIIVESFEYSEIDKFLKDYDFEDIEPFTLIKITHAGESKFLHEIRWDGQQLYHFEVDGKQAHIWSSVTLYDESMRAKRNLWFEEWLQSGKEFTTKNIRDFHLYGGEGDPTVDFRMTRSGGLQTISISSINLSSDNACMEYLNLISRQSTRESLSLKSSINSV